LASSLQYSQASIEASGVCHLPSVGPKRDKRD
jgi:hypothetical protein